MMELSQPKYCTLDYGGEKVGRDSGLRKKSAHARACSAGLARARLLRGSSRARLLRGSSRARLLRGSLRAHPPVALVKL
uniref:Uncharacterized protein n=1 Tax=Globodera pallida TaxID=36090 RepID=A0A183BWE6_GLOPA